MNGDKSYFDRALKKYGEDNFELTILENDIPNDKLDEREIYYIKKYNTFNNGYNCTLGGKCYGKKFNDEFIYNVEQMIEETDLSFLKISEIVGCSLETVSDINNGFSHSQHREKYPIREHRNTQKFFDNDIENVIWYLQNTSYSFEKIGDLTDTNNYLVADVNYGKRMLRDSTVEYPIRVTKVRREITYEEAKFIISELQKNDLSSKEIGDILGVPDYTISRINRGEHVACKYFEELDFPIRKKQYRSKDPAKKATAKVTIYDVQEIENLLINTNDSYEDIANKYGVKRQAIKDIDIGRTWKQYLTTKDFPIRK